MAGVSRRALITGITGQDGSYLTELLLAKGYEVHGIVRRASTFNRGRLEHLFRDPHTVQLPLTLHYADMSDSSSLQRIVQAVRPDEVYNLAAQSHVGISFDVPEYTGDVTGLGAVRLLEAIRSSQLPCRFYQASSSELFGKVQDVPQTEGTAIHPRSPYACAKAYAFTLTRMYREAYGMYAVNGILFNHESPRRGENFVTRKITLSLARILTGQLECLYLGNLEARRDWGYAKEYVDGMWRMLQQPVPDDFVLATGHAASVREFLELCLRRARIPFVRRGTDREETYVDTRTGKTIVAIDPRYERPAEVDLLVGDASKARRTLGWESRTTLAELATLMLEADCALVGAPLEASASSVA